MPSIQVYESHAICTSVPVFEFVIVKSRVTKLSHPALEYHHSSGIVTCSIGITIYPSI